MSREEHLEAISKLGTLLKAKIEHYEGLHLRNAWLHFEDAFSAHQIVRLEKFLSVLDELEKEL